MRQPLHYPWLNLDVDDRSAPVIAVRVDVIGTKAEVPDHRHRKGQLVFALGGGVTCRVPSGLWMVPPHCGVWVPGGMRHSNLATANARLFFVYIEPEVVDLPDRCCTLSISPLLRELTVELSDQVADDDEREDLVMPPLHEWRGFVALSGHRFSTLNRKLGTETFSLCPRRMAQIGQQEEDREP